MNSPDTTDRLNVFFFVVFAFSDVFNMMTNVPQQMKQKK